jgi:hypothetical protein
MAFGVNSSETKHFNEIILYTGISKVNIVAINPTLAQLNDIGFKFEKEPEYLSTGDDGTKKVRIDVIVKNDKFKTKFAFFLEDKNRESKTTAGSFEIVNDFGQSTWAASPEDAINKIGRNGNKWFKPDGARIAKVGEVALITFLRDWANTGVEEVGKIDNFAALFNGNFKELQDYVRILSNNTIYTLATVKEGKYQGMYTGYFVRTQFAIKTAENKFADFLKKQKDAGYPIKESYSLEFREYTGGAIEPDKDETPASTYNNLDNQF